MTELLAPLKRENILRLAKEGKRLDGRALEQQRKVKIETRFHDKAEGCARITWGNTQVMVGVKFGLGTPYPDSPDSGTLSVNAELVPMADPSFESGRPDERSIELARVVDRGIRESKSIDLEKLCIDKGKKVWMVYVDLWVLDHDGNLIDACGLGALSALMTAKVPELKLEGEDNYVRTGNSYPLPMRDKPIPCTTVKVGDYLLVDPTVDEECGMDTRITITTNQNGEICAIQKGESGEFTEEDILKAAQYSVEKGAEMRNLLPAEQ